MDVLTILSIIGALAVGFVLGLAVKSFLDNDELLTLEKEIANLHRENSKLKKHDVIEIIDHTAEPDSYFTPF